ncbi:MAG: DUF1761 domain-containing protein [Rhabdochlamydiaceae bacterium]
MNYLAIIIAAIVNVVLGSLWYSPVLFAKPWAKGMGMTKEQIGKGMKMNAGMFFPPLIAALVSAFVLAWFLESLHVTTLMGGIKIGFLGWLGFTTTAQVLNSWIFSNGRPKEVYFINTAYHLVTFCIMGAILAVWR